MPGLLGVDPGIRGTGLALFTRQELYPVKVSNLCPIHEDPWGKRSDYITQHFEDFIYKNRPGEMYLELPVFFGSTKRGLQAARQGDLVKLAMLAGMLYHIAHSNGVEVYTIEPIEWKGRKNKEDGHKAVLKILPNLANNKPKLSEHVLDACGIGLYGKGLIARGLRKRERP